MTESVITETRTEVTTKEVTETRYRCHVCDMVYDEDQVLKIGLDRQAGDGDLFSEGAQPRAERTICQHCADGLFDYEADGGGAFDQSNTRFEQDWLNTTAALTVVAMFVTTPVAVIAAGVAGAGGNATLVLAPAAAALAGLLAGWQL